MDSVLFTALCSYENCSSPPRSILGNHIPVRNTDRKSHHGRFTLALEAKLGSSNVTCALRQFPVQYLSFSSYVCLPVCLFICFPLSLPLPAQVVSWLSLVGLVVRRPPRERKVPGSNPACAGIFSGSSHTSDFNIGTPVVTLPGAWRYRVSTGTGRPGVSIL